TDLAATPAAHALRAVVLGEAAEVAARAGRFEQGLALLGRATALGADGMAQAEGRRAEILARWLAALDARGDAAGVATVYAAYATEVQNAAPADRATVAHALGRLGLHRAAVRVLATWACGPWWRRRCSLRPAAPPRRARSSSRRRRRRRARCSSRRRPRRRRGRGPRPRTPTRGRSRRARRRPSACWPRPGWSASRAPAASRRGPSRRWPRCARRTTSSRAGWAGRSRPDEGATRATLGPARGHRPRAAAAA